MGGCATLLPWAMGAGAVLLGLGGLALSLRQDKKRRRAMAAAAQCLGLEFQESAPALAAEEYRSLHVFSQGRDRTYRNILSGKLAGAGEVILCDYRYTTGDGKSTRTHGQTVALLAYPKGNLPRFELRPETAFHKIGSLFGYQDIDFAFSPAFSRSYLLRGPDEEALRNLFGPDMLRYFEAHAGWCVDGRGSWLAVYRHGRFARPEELPDLLNEVKDLLGAFPG